jgi:hypothetical protein
MLKALDDDMIMFQCCLTTEVAVDQTIRFLEGIAKDIMVKVQDYYVLADFMILDMEEEEEEEEDVSIILRRPFLSTTNTIIYIEQKV